MIDGWGLLYVSPLFFSTLIGLGVAQYLFRHRQVPSSVPLLALTIAASLWSFAYAMELLVPGYEAKLLWSKIVYIGVVSVPLAWVIFALRFFGSPDWTNQVGYRILLGVLPAITLLMAWTNEYHGVLWQEVFLRPVGPFYTLGVNHGPWFYVHLVYSYALLTWGSARLVGGLFSSPRLYRWQIALILLAVAVPWLANLIYISRLNPIPHLDLTPFAFTITGLLMTTSLFCYRLIEDLPIVQKTVFSGLPDCHMVLDREDCLVDMNQAAVQTLGRPANEVLGKPLPELVPAFAPYLVQTSLDQEVHAELSMGEGAERRYYDLHISPLSGEYPLAVGRLVVCHEITLQKQVREQLEQAVAERTADLELAVVRLQNELAERALAERRFKQMVDSAPDAMVLTDAEGVIQLVNAQAERLLGYTRKEMVNAQYDFLIPEEYRPTLQGVVENFSEERDSFPRSYSLQVSALRKDGQLLPLEISMGKLETAGGFWVSVTLRDISQRVTQEQEQRRLLERVRRSREQLGALAIRLEEVQEAEQRRIAVELHDRVGQSLTGLNLNLQAIQSHVPSDQAELLQRLEDSLALVEETTRQVRGLMGELDPPLLREYGLLPALRFGTQRFVERTGIQVSVIGDENLPRLPLRAETTLFRIVQECMTNVVKHAQASQVQISLEREGEDFVLAVQDDGVGFDPENLPVQEIQPTWGLVAIGERANAIGGELLIDSAPGKGATIQITIRGGVK